MALFPWVRGGFSINDKTVTLKPALCAGFMKVKFNFYGTGLGRRMQMTGHQVATPGVDKFRRLLLASRHHVRAAGVESAARRPSPKP